MVLDATRYIWKSIADESGYLAIANRGETLARGPDREAYRCEFQFTSDLRAPRLIPWLGRLMLGKAQAAFPFCFRTRPMSSSQSPEVSFLIGHRGAERIPLLLSTLKTIAAQADTGIEAIVVEQSMTPVLREKLPAWVRYVHTPVDENEPYNRSWAFNVGAKHARAPILILHDNDLLVPSAYSSEVVNRVRSGAEIVSLKRFIFYLDERTTRNLIDRDDLQDILPASIMQNAQGGGSIAITSEAFDRLGGMDEGFRGWGGEDNEFWQRCRTLKCWEYGYLSLIHLWHESQPLKADCRNETLNRFTSLSQIPPEERIDALAAVARGKDRPRHEDPFVKWLES